ncbi:hypothetical protein [Clostridium kluyveri]|uniref:Uncharacterized protein n=1 Tax=Clostridium kluyveri TaxID=1534 RepID=A0A1L5F2V0_CLOKL|nr:hypothetical protein [Clostridium kluyveri]APM37324.1 hypothetical protein BS101_00360 [Clostridium kluyveri]
MLEMPQNIKQKLRNLNLVCLKVNNLEKQLEKDFMSFGVNPDVLRGVGNAKVRTEAFSGIVNCSGDIEENIKEIEKVFLYYVGKQK